MWISMMTTLKPRWADLEKLFECKKKCLEQVFFLADSIQVILVPYKLITTRIFFKPHSICIRGWREVAALSIGGLDPRH